MKKMAATIVVAITITLSLEAAGLATWAERLEVGPWRDAAIKVSRSWQSVNQILHLDEPRRTALELREELALVMISEPSVVEVVVKTDLSLPKDPVSVSLPDAALNITTAPALLPQPVSLDNDSINHIALVGDSIMAVGLAPALRRSVLKNDELKIIRAYRSGTGLGRPEVFNWVEQYPQMLGAQKPDLVICAMGANDAQGFQVGRNVISFGTPAWEEMYALRLRAFLDVLTRDQAKVLWIGMPVMRDPGFSKKMIFINMIVRRILADYPQVTWIDPNPFLTDASGSFEQFRQNQKGKMIRMRADDGIHLSDEGAAYIVPAINEWLASGVAKSD